MSTKSHKRLWYAVAGVCGLALVIQLIPVSINNPPVSSEVAAPPAVGAILRRACYDCHSNETVLPWYGHVAPASWLLWRDVTEGRAAVNFSEWGSLTAEARTKIQKKAWSEIDGGDMPPAYYRPLHSASALTDEDRRVLKDWLLGTAPL